MTEPGKRTAQEFYNQVWTKEHTEPNGNWPIDFAEAYHAYAQQPGGLMPTRQLDALKDFISSVCEWAAKYPLQGPKSEADDNAATEIYAFCEGAEENLYEVRQFVSKATISPVSEAPPAQTCPTCGMDIRCIHGVLFQDKCEPCEAPDPPGAEAQTAIPQRVFFGRPGQDIPARRNETVYLREDGQSIVIYHDEALLPLLGSELLNKIKAWAMGAEAQTKEAD